MDLAIAELELRNQVKRTQFKGAELSILIKG